MRSGRRRRWPGWEDGGGGGGGAERVRVAGSRRPGPGATPTPPARLPAMGNEASLEGGAGDGPLPPGGSGPARAPVPGSRLQHWQAEDSSRRQAGRGRPPDPRVQAPGLGVVRAGKRAAQLPGAGAGGHGSV